MSITIRFDDNGTFHNDLFVAVGGTERQCDTYYFALDREMEPDLEDADKVRRVLVRLLQQWVEALHTQRDRKLVFLPFDFSDQYTGCLECRRDGESVCVRMGSSRREGWSFCPSDISSYVRSVRDFQSYWEEPIRFDREELIGMIEQSMRAIAKK